MPLGVRVAIPNMARGCPFTCSFCSQWKFWRDYRIRDLGWVYCQGGGYFGGFNDKLGQGVYRGEYHQEGEVWDVSHPTTITDSEGRSFEFDHDWAECFTLVESAAGNGMAHYECVRIRSKEA